MEGLAREVRAGLLGDASAFERIEAAVDDLVAEAGKKAAAAATAAAGAEAGAEARLPGSIIQQLLLQHTSLDAASCVALAAVKEAEVARAMGVCSAETVGRLYRLVKAMKLPNKMPRNVVDSNVVCSAPALAAEGDLEMTLVCELGTSRQMLVKTELVRRVCADAVQVVPNPAAVGPCVVAVPGSKSVSNRALLLAGLSEGSCIIKGLLHSDDTQVMMTALEQLGASFAFLPGAVKVTGNGGKFAKPTKPLYMGNAGTATRFVVSLCTLISDASHATVMHGSHRMLERPQGPLVDALRANGCKVKYLGESGTLPLAISGGGLKGGDLQMSGQVSSQFVSSVLFAAPYAASPLTLTLNEANPTSISYIEMTLQTMAHFGVHVERLALNKFRVPLGGYKCPAEYFVEADASSATYPLAVAAITGRSITVRGVGKSSLQGDAGFCKLLEKMGCKVEQTDDSTTVTGPAHGNLQPVSVNMADLTDAFLTATVVAAVTEGRTHINGIANQHVKECDRIKAMVTELAKCGVVCENLEDGIVVHGKRIPEAFREAVVDTYDDHRIAMSFAVLGTRLKNLVIIDKDCTDKTYPEFWDDFSSLQYQVQGRAANTSKWTSESIVLVGMRGAGKTTMGKAAAAHLGLTFLDMDDALIASTGEASCQAIVEKFGWAGFRQLETRLLEQTLKSDVTKSNHVIACGGGVVETLEARRLLCEHAGPVVHVMRNFEDIQALLEPGADSPLKKTKVDEEKRPTFAEPVADVWKRRHPWFEAVSSHVFAIPLAGSESKLLEQLPKAQMDFCRFLDGLKRVATPDVFACREAAVVVVLKEPVYSNLAEWRYTTALPLIARSDDLNMLWMAHRSGIEAIEVSSTKLSAQTKANFLMRLGPCRVEIDVQSGWAYPLVKVQTPALPSAGVVQRYYLFGHPISASPSPTMHNTGFGLLNKGALKVYELCECNDVARVQKMTRLSVFAGASVTIPFKESVIAFVEVLSDDAKAIGSVNTLVRSKNKLCGDNTDWRGIVNLLSRAGVPQQQAAVKGVVFLVLGAGGTARAACYAAQKLKMDLVVWNRTLSKATELAKRFGGRATDSLEAADLGHVGVVVGTVPASAQVTCPANVFATKPVVLDAAYRPRQTRLLLDAQNHGCVVIEGVEMLIEQGFEQMRIWEAGSLQGRESVVLSDELVAKVRTAVLERYDLGSRV